jgi:diguanylate cyclase (GGDEF)-like protein
MTAPARTSAPPPNAAADPGAAALASAADAPRSLGSPLGSAFERHARRQRRTTIGLLCGVLLLVVLLGLQGWRSQRAVHQQRQLHSALNELNDLRQRAELAEAALGTYRATGNSALLLSAQPCSGQCLSTLKLSLAAPQDGAALADTLRRVLHWANRVDTALYLIGQDAGQSPQGADIADEALSQGSRQLRSNLLGLERNLLQRLDVSESDRYQETLLLQLLLACLGLTALGGLSLTLRRSSRLAVAGLSAEQALRELSLRDPLTGLPNRRALGLRLEHMIERAQRHGGGPAVLAVDLDSFKQINEMHGHGAGDAALVEVAQRLLAALRKSDLPARVGGDEFVVLLDDPDSPETARAVGERLLLALRAPITLPPPLGPVELGASVGLSHYPACGSSAQALLDAADAALYAAKLAGRNRLFEFRPDVVQPDYCTVCGGSPSVLPGRKSSVTSMASNS